MSAGGCCLHDLCTRTLTLSCDMAVQARPSCAQGDDRWHHLDEEEDQQQLTWLDEADAPRVRGDEGADAPPGGGGGEGRRGYGGDYGPVPVLRGWSWTSDGKLEGRVYGKQGFKDGTSITTSAVDRSQRFHTHAVTEAGTVYLLGEPAGQGSTKRSAQGEQVLGVAKQRRLGGNGDLTGVRLECSICREACSPTEADWHVTPCKHAFHEECLWRWVRQCAEDSLKEENPHAATKPTCPDCRAPLSSSRFRMFE